MIRVTHLFLVSKDGGDVEDYIHKTYLPLIEGLPDMLRYEIAFVIGPTLGNTPAHAILDQYFQDEDAMNAAMASPSGKALSREIMANPRIAPELIISRVTEIG